MFFFMHQMFSDCLASLLRIIKSLLAVGPNLYLKDKKT